MENFQYILILLIWTVSTLALCRRFSLPPIFGYLLVGIIVGPGGVGMIPGLQELDFLAEFGVVFLMFTIGLEFSLARLFALRSTMIGLGGLQVILCTALVTLGGWYLGLRPQTAFIAGGALALSSTAVVIKQLTEQNEINTTHGRFSLSVLLFQDLVAVLFLILIRSFAGAESADSLFFSLSTTFLKGILVCIALGLLGKWLIRPLFRQVAKVHSTELFMLFVLLIVLGSAWLTHHLQLSMALGAFLAGMILGETEFRHQVETGIRSFRDILLGLFFIIVGAAFQIKELNHHWQWVLLLLVVLVTSKTFLIMALTRIISKVSYKKSFRTGLILAQGGEFSFVLFTQAVKYKLLVPEQNQILVATVVLSIMIAPLLILYNRKLAILLFRSSQEGNVEDIPQTPLSKYTSKLENHVIICGFGRVGQILARFLEQEKLPFVALDLDPLRIQSAFLAGEPVFLGDICRPEVLAAAGLGKARMVVISLSHENTALETLNHIRAFHRDVPVFVRTRDDGRLEAFQAAGATEVIPEILEASLMLASHLLLALGVPVSRVLSKIKAVRTDRYRVLQGYFRGADDESILLENHDEARKGLHTITMTDQCSAVGKTVREVINTEERPLIQALKRKTVRHTPPPWNMQIKAGDVLVLYATPEKAYQLQEKLLRREKKQADD